MKRLLIFTLLSFVALQQAQTLNKKDNLRNNVDSCSQFQAFNVITNSCQCIPVDCGNGQIQSKQTCQCIGTCAQKDKCQEGWQWSQLSCQCVPICMTLNCSPEAQWSTAECMCICKSINQCIQPSEWNEELCSCTPVIPNQNLILNFINKPLCFSIQQTCGPNQYWSNSRCQCI